MKCPDDIIQRKADASLPVRGAWIEMLNARPFVMYGASLPVRGAWIEMLKVRHLKIARFRRSPCGERGLKCVSINRKKLSELVAPRAGSVD